MCIFDDADFPVVVPEFGVGYGLGVYFFGTVGERKGYEEKEEGVGRYGVCGAVTVHEDSI